MKRVRDEIKSMKHEESTIDTLRDYCDFIHDLYGLVDACTQDSDTTLAEDKMCVQWGRCVYTLKEGYKPNDIQYERSVPQDKPQTPTLVSLPQALTPRPSNKGTLPTPSLSPSDMQSKVTFKPVIVTDYDYCVLNQFQLICDQNCPSSNGSKGSQEYVKAFVRCKHCSSDMAEISSLQDFKSSKHLSLHLQRCKSLNESTKEEISRLDSLRESQMISHVGIIVPLKEYTLKVFEKYYHLKDSADGGLRIKRIKKFSDLSVFALPLIVYDLIVPASKHGQTEPSSTNDRAL
jgi:phage FluMu protein Com